MASNFPTAYVRVASQTYVLQHIFRHVATQRVHHTLTYVFHFPTKVRPTECAVLRLQLRVTGSELIESDLGIQSFIGHHQNCGDIIRDTSSESSGSGNHPHEIPADL